MKEILKVRGMSANEIRWTLSAKCLSGSLTWGSLTQKHQIWGVLSWEQLNLAFPGQMAWTEDGWRKHCEEWGRYAHVVYGASDRQAQVWSKQGGAVYLSTGSMTTLHESKERIHEEIDNFLGYLLESRFGDYAFVTCNIIKAGEQTRSRKWQIMVVDVDVHAVAAELHAAF